MNRFFEYLIWEVKEMFKRLGRLFLNFRKPSYTHTFLTYALFILVVSGRTVYNIEVKIVLLCLLFSFIWKSKADRYTKFVGERRKRV